MNQDKTAIIIGSGVAGLAASIRLAIQGFTVHVFEKNESAGGKLTAFVKDQFHFDAGPSLFTQPSGIIELFELAGEPAADYFTYQSVPISCKYFFENGKSISAPSDAAGMAREMQDQLGEQEGKVIKYMRDAHNNYERIGGVFLEHSLHKRKTWLHTRVLNALKALKPAYLLQSLNNYNKKRFASPEAVQVFNRFATYNGSNPYLAPAMLSVIPHLELNQGTYYPNGGMISITKALEGLAKKKGVQFHFNSPVERIIHHEGEIRGVVVGGQNISADVVVSNADAYFTYRNLLGDLYKTKKLEKQERSSSALVFYWGINRSFPELGLHNILFSDHYKEEFDYLFTKKSIHPDPTVYINITSKNDAHHAPAGKENWFVMINAPANRGQAWQDALPELRKRVIEKINRLLGCDIESCIETEEYLDPKLIEERTHAFTGSLYGTSSNSRFAAFMRHPNFSSTIRNLYFCGGTVHPGGGIPLCLKSARIVADLVATDQRKSKKH